MLVFEGARSVGVGAGRLPNFLQLEHGDGLDLLG
jgi:hypothetical protein